MLYPPRLVLALVADSASILQCGRASHPQISVKGPMQKFPSGPINLLAHSTHNVNALGLRAGSIWAQASSQSRGEAPLVMTALNSLGTNAHLLPPVPKRFHDSPQILLELRLKST